LPQQFGWVWTPSWGWVGLALAKSRPPQSRVEPWSHTTTLLRWTTIGFDPPHTNWGELQGLNVGIRVPVDIYKCLLHNYRLHRQRWSPIPLRHLP
jgi:hypothetical protein